MSNPLFTPVTQGYNNNVVGAPPAAFAFGGSQIFGSSQSVLSQGSTAGVPAPQNAVGMVAGGAANAASQAIDFSKSITPTGVLNQPVFWLVVVLVVSVWMMGHIAHVNVK